MTEHIRQFLNQQHILALASWSSDGPYICNCFYCYTELDLPEPVPGLIIASEHRARHAREMQAHAAVAVAIHKPGRQVAEIQGVQIQGYACAISPKQESSVTEAVNESFYLQADQISQAVVSQAVARQADSIKDLYLNAFPEAQAIDPLPLWFIRIDWLKYTDNRIKFGHKEIWQAEYDTVD